MNKKCIVLTISLAIVLFTKLIPSIVLGTMFSTDSWPILYNVNVLKDNPSAHIFNSKLFDGYNNRWPFVIIFSYIASTVMGVDTMDALRIVVPFVNGLGTIILVVLFKKFSGEKLSSYVLPLVLFMMPSVLIFTSAPSKESFAHPLFYLALLLGISIMKNANKVNVMVFLVSFLALTLSHHLTTLVLLLTFITIAIYTRLRKILIGEIIDRYPLSIIVLILIIVSAHTILIGGTSLSRVASPYELVDLFLYYLFFISLFSVLLKWKHDKLIFKTKGLALSITLTIIIVWLLAFSVKKSIVYGIRPLGLDVLYYSIPLLPAPILTYVGLKALSRRKEYIFILSIISSIVSIVVYFAIGNPITTNILHRAINFLLIPLSMIYVSIILVRTRLFKLVFIALLILILLSATITEYRIFTEEDNISYYWVYRTSEYKAMYFIDKYGFTGYIIGDSKVLYLAKAFKIPVDIGGLKKLFRGNLDRSTVFIYRENLFKGFVVSLNIIKSKVNFKDIVSRADLVYNNAEVTIFRGIGS